MCKKNNDNPSVKMKCIFILLSSKQSEEQPSSAASSRKRRRRIRSLEKQARREAVSVATPTQEEVEEGTEVSTTEGGKLKSTLTSVSDSSQSGSVVQTNNTSNQAPIMPSSNMVVSSLGAKFETLSAPSSAWSQVKKQEFPKEDRAKLSQKELLKLMSSAQAAVSERILAETTLDTATITDSSYNESIKNVVEK